MGAGPSRGISVRNPEPPGKIIQITEDVAKRMTQRYGQEQQAETPALPRSSSAKPQQVPQQGILNVGTEGFPVVETVSAYEVRAQKEAEIRQNDEVWTRKLKELESRYIAAAYAAEGEFTKELEKLDKLVPQPKEPVCQDHTVKVAQCYQQNSSQALKCSDVVREFALCVEQHSQRGSSPSAAA